MDPCQLAGSGRAARRATSDLRHLPLAAAWCLIILACAACGGQTPPAPAATPDPFAGLVAQAQRAYDEGTDLYARGQYLDALNAFERARTLNPQIDPRTEHMVAEARTALTPTATPVTPTATPIPTATPVVMSSVTPAKGAGAPFFGDVFLTVVPPFDGVPTPVAAFVYQDQVGLYVGTLGQQQVVPFALRVFDHDSRALVADVTVSRDGGMPTTTGTAGRPFATSASASTLFGTPMPTATLGANQYPAVRFFSRLVWYHTGGERPGHYRLELYAGAVLTNVFDYVVGTERAPTPPLTATPEAAPTADESAAQASQVILPQEPVPPVMAPAPPIAAPAPPAAPPAPPTAAAAHAEPRAPTATPEPTIAPTPASAVAAVTGGAPAALGVNQDSGRVYVVDTSGVIWTMDGGRPTLNRPFSLGCPAGAACQPSSQWVPDALAVNPENGVVYVAAHARGTSAVVVLDGQTGGRIGEIPLPAPAAEVGVDAELGVLYVLLPDRGAVAMVDLRAGRVARIRDGLPMVTGIAVDAVRHQLAIGQLTGTVSLLDGATGQIVGTLDTGSAGLSSVAVARGLVYAINPADHTLAVLRPASSTVDRYALDDEPAAVAAGDSSGAVYVVSSQQNVVIRLNPTDGSEIGRVLLPAEGGPPRTRAAAGPTRERSRLTMNPGDETLYVTRPGAGAVSVVPSDLFPALRQPIPRAKADA